MKKLLIILLFISITTAGIYYAQEVKSTPTITYFPIDYRTSFDSAKTNLELYSSDDNNAYEILWHVKSKSETPMYLRQDVSLLFADGKLMGMRSQWRENTDTIQFREKFSSDKNHQWETITFHYGEIHTNEDINSIQHMSHDQLYVFKEHTRFIGFHSNQSNLITKLLLDESMKENLLAHWQDLLFHFHLDINNYYSIPLTSLYRYQENPLPTLNQKNTDRVIGQLWEGLYKNYIIPNIDSKENLNSFMPLILIDKNGESLLVIYEINGKKEKLIQKIR
ncbi:hypothetical protein [Ornithinibacillus californiensis]|uniref:hypothetical protein n=1 Tax=Ornithinibacillus californiensis TaxID=161536 RepID=UPI00064DAEDF|nr:hypothetical protein [Ornithinibacillus californiensis]